MFIQQYGSSTMLHSTEVFLPCRVLSVCIMLSLRKFTCTIICTLLKADITYKIFVNIDSKGIYTQKRAHHKVWEDGLVLFLTLFFYSVSVGCLKWWNWRTWGWHCGVVLQECDVVLMFPSGAQDFTLMWLLSRLRAGTPGLVVHVRHHASSDSYGFYLTAPFNVWVLNRLLRYSNHWTNSMHRVFLEWW